MFSIVHAGAAIKIYRGYPCSVHPHLGSLSQVGCWAGHTLAGCVWAHSLVPLSQAWFGNTRYLLRGGCVGRDVRCEKLLQLFLGQWGAGPELRSMPDLSCLPQSHFQCFHIHKSTSQLLQASGKRAVCNCNWLIKLLFPLFSLLCH